MGQAQLITDLTVDISQDAEGLYTYVYTIENAAFSSQAVNTFFVSTGAKTDVIDIFGPNDQWIAGYDKEEVRANLQAYFITGLSADGSECGVTDEFDLNPGNSANFTIKSAWGPDTKNYTIGNTGPGCNYVGDRIEGDILVPAILDGNPTAPCDFDGDGDCDVVDIDNLAFTILEGNNDPIYDLSEDSSVDFADLELFLSQVGSRNGDLDLNGTVEFADFLGLSSNFGLEAEWSGGDLNVDSTVGFPDFLILSENFGQSGAGALAAVPEPATGGMALMFFVCCSALRRKRN